MWRAKVIPIESDPSLITHHRSRKIAFGCPARQGGEEKGLLPEAAPIL